MLLKLALVLTLLLVAKADCAFLVNDTFWPYIPDASEKEGFTILDAECQEWLGKQGCCNNNGYLQMVENFKKIDAVFGGSGGCDLCAINLKRFWCQYACDPNQGNFSKVGDWIWVPSYDKPGVEVYVQQIYLTVESETACKLFESCKRTPYASQLSALQSPAGFLNFQGTNAIDAHQIIYVEFTEEKTKGLYIEDVDNCSVVLPPAEETYRGFKTVSNCSCNSCESQCTGTSYYKPNPVMYGFNYELVFWVWGGVTVAIVGLTLLRHYKNKPRN